MAPKTKKKTSTLGQLEKRVVRLRKDIVKTVDRVGREAKTYIPKSRRRQFDDILERVEDFSGTVTKRVTNTVKGVASDVEDTVVDLRDTVDDLRGTVEKRVRALRKDTVERTQDAIDTIEKETRKQVERFLNAIGLPARSEVDGIKRRLTSLERKIEDFLESSSRRRSRSDESEAA